jgi:hypothetical protein
VDRGIVALRNSSELKRLFLGTEVCRPIAIQIMANMQSQLQKSLKLFKLFEETIRKATRSSES